MDISVVVPTFNRRKTVARVLGTLFAQSVSVLDYEVIAVVDGSTDGTADALRLLRPSCGFRVIEQENGGPSAARNTGYRAAEADLVLYIDDDMLCDQGLVAEHIAAHRERPRAVAFGSLFLSVDSPPGLAAECFRREVGAFHLERKWSPDLEWRIADCVFSNASLPRALLDELGGFDETFRMREDLELGVRLFRAGVHPLYIESAVAHQYFEKNSADLIRDAEAFASGDVQFARKHPEVLIEGQLNWLARGPLWKRRMLRIAAVFPAVVDFLLMPMCACGETFFGVRAIRNAGMRALQIRRRVHWYHRVLELGWRFSESKSKSAN